MAGPASHKAITSDSAVSVGPGQLISVLLTADGAAATVIVYDDPDSADGTVLCKLKAADGTSAQWSPCKPIVFSKGAYADITGSGAAAYVAYI